MVIDSLEVAGGERQVVDVAVSLHRRGYAITVACSTGGLLSQVLESEGVPVRLLMDRLVKRRVSAGYAWKLRALLREGDFDLVHAHLYASTLAAALAGLATALPLVATQHSEAAWRGPRARLASRWAYRRTERVIAVSHGIRDRLIEEDGVSPERITVIHNAVTPPDPAARCGVDLPPEWSEGPAVGVVARLQPEKGVRVFLQAVPFILERCPGCHFLIVGDGPLRAELEARSGELGLQDRVHFLGFQTSSRALIARLDMLAVPSLSEGTPLVVLEAMTAGVPIVASEVGGIPEQIRHGQEGLLVPPGDPIALSEACVELLRDSARARQLGETGRRHASTDFDHKRMVDRIEAVYDAILNAAVMDAGSVRSVT